MDDQLLLLIAGVVAFLGLSGGAFFLFRRKPGSKPSPPSQLENKSASTPSVVEPQTEAPQKIVLERSESEEVSPAPKPADLGERLSKTRSLFSKIASTFSGQPPSQFSQDQWDAVEEALLEADVGFQTTAVILDRVREKSKNSNGASLSHLIVEECKSLFVQAQPLAVLTPQAESENLSPKPFVISVVGINGVGKTTTIGKLANKLKLSGKKVLLGAADTFRAGATAQLRIWSERVDCDFVSGREGADPGAVAFDALTAGKARGSDVVLLDTAGRLHTKTNLMAELEKIHRVMKKVIPEAPHETWLVLDGTLGQNSLEQAREFCKTLGVTGVVVTKLDGTAKGGALLAISSELGVPVRFIGIGESIEDLIVFKQEAYLQAILPVT